MTLFVLGLACMIASIIAGIIWLSIRKKTELANGIGVLLLTIGLFVASIVLGLVSTALYVEDDQGGIIVKKFGTDLPSGKIIATDGEKGPQAYVLPPGWHFFYWPWMYDLTAVNNIDISQGKIGVVTARDGVTLPDGEIFAESWDSPNDMMDGEKFLSEGGAKGPQLTVLPPGQYRYNPRLFQVDVQEALEVPIGTVAVIKANAGEAFKGEGETAPDIVNGVPIVPNGFRGIWNNALTPNAYYLHPDAYKVTLVKTVKRVYSYTASHVNNEGNKNKQDNSIRVRTKDGFEFPVDVRVSVKVSAENAPYVVAMLANPDADQNKDGFDELENRAVLPSLRSIFRNSAEDKEALGYVSSRSTIEQSAFELFEQDMDKFKINVDAVYIADIGLDKSEEGKRLLQTQTDKKIAEKEQETYEEQERAEMARANVVKAKEAADQEKLKEAAKAKIDIAQSEASAKIALAEGEATAYTKKMDALGGVDNFVKLEALRMISEQWNGEVPTVLAGGSGQANLDALVATMLKQEAKNQNK
ncbi:MAG: hypothetical protein MK193_04040 [Lentisphaeria bacterium]|nr:hypothetical protein [Lentisphaeria bacterium]